MNYRLKCKKEHQTSAKSPNRLPVTAPTLNKHLQMVNTEPFWPKRAHMGASWAHKRPYGSVWAHMGPARAHNVRETVLEIKIFGGKRGAVLTHHVLTYRQKHRHHLRRRPNGGAAFAPLGRRRNKIVLSSTDMQ